MSDTSDAEREQTAARDMDGVKPENVRAVRLGHGANCSSVGSVIDTLFASAVVGGAIFAAIAAALRNEDVTVVGPQGNRAPAPEDEPGVAPEKDEAAP
ncbi:MAG: hypothetical protein JWM74_2711 [Myxococcaceae bacterium]|jgi:hypothetical protein|nr:hypothetical protein [Myxococcaceae bacterium]